MTKAFVSAFALLVLVPAAQASPATSARQSITVTHPHNYWLSDGLNRLVFWQAPASTRTNSRVELGTRLTAAGS